jgi:UbiD family decarboxylase
MGEDLRDWQRQVEEREDLKVVKEASWEQDIGFITAFYWKNWRNSPALMFDEVPGYPTGFRVLSNFVLSPRRVALTMGLPEHGSDSEMREALLQKLLQWEAGAGDFAPKVVGRGPVLENVMKGEDIDLLHFPSPKWHELDGGRYIGTGCAVITQDPDTGEVNLGCYRNMVLDGKNLALQASPGKHGRLHYEKYHSRGRPCPVAVSVGHHPLFFAMAGVEIPVAEYHFAGAMRGEPVEVIQEEVTGLPIPADSEIVIVGWCYPERTRPEGPFGEVTGYYASKGRQEPYIEVERVYYRNNPIILGAPQGKPPHSVSFYQALVRSAVLEHELRKTGIPDIIGLWTHEAPSSLFITVSIKQRYAGHAKQVALATRHLIGAGMSRYIIVVDEDIDVTNIADVIWALTTRSDPEKHIDIIRRAKSSLIDPIIRKPAEVYMASTALIEACKPFEWKDEFPEAVEFSTEVTERMMTRWGKVLGASATSKKEGEESQL